MTNRIECYRRLKPVIDNLRQVLTMMGFSDSCSHIVATMYVIRDRMTIDDLSQLTSYAKSTVFSCLNLLERLGFITKEKKGRKYLYTPISNPSDIVVDKIKQILEKGIRPLLDVLERICREEVDDNVRRKAHEMLINVKRLAEFLSKIVHETK